METIDIYAYQKQYHGYQHIAGLDEVGRGCLAGPVVSACVILPKGCTLPVKDSKKLSEKKRNQLYDEIKAIAIACEVGIIEPEIIDKINILEATKLSMETALEKMQITPDFILIDALTINTHIPQKGIISGDATIAAIAAASIIAKVTRDTLMTAYAKTYPQYGFEKHKGYGTKQHKEAIQAHGLCELHRRSFKLI